ncbi:hypothetical protein KSS87_000914 [Heliosperma pusillum]|nr:hypothetical protein KSS87_000914 [Heliosperma pusillum]
MGSIRDLGWLSYGVWRMAYGVTDFPDFPSYVQFFLVILPIPQRALADISSLIACGNGVAESALEFVNSLFPIVEPDPGHTRLRLSREGLEAIKKITSPIAAVAVIGPYRSGKSFLLNQLLSLSCFGVGHMRDTKTKGIWVWGTPIEVKVDGVKTSVLYLDTEGFESIGKSNVYDDRIFALATVMSSVLIYNLPETVREADISRLSFAVELAEEFYGREKMLLLTRLSCYGSYNEIFCVCSLIGFTLNIFQGEGKSVHEMVNEALRRVPNHNDDRDLEQVNQIRESLAKMGDNSTAFSLPQPHLQRTKLCEMNDADLDPGYVRKREQLKDVVTSLVRPKIVQGNMLNGKQFVSFLEKGCGGDNDEWLMKLMKEACQEEVVVGAGVELKVLGVGGRMRGMIIEALNKGEIPTTGSLVEVFNKKIVERCLKLYGERMSVLKFPLSEVSLRGAHEKSRADAMRAFDEQHFGRQHAKKSVEQLDDEIQKVMNNFIISNEYQSTKLCETLYTTCEDRMDQLQVLRLPSMAKFNAGFLQCNQSFQQECIGPAKVNYEHRMLKMLGTARSLFIKEYNNRLFNWLVGFSLVMVVVGRFIIKFFLIEIGAWIMFIFLETYTRMFWTAESLYYNPVWHVIVGTWETLVYSPILDLDRWAIPLCVVAAVFILYWRFYGRKRYGYRWLLPMYNTHKSNSSRQRTE